MATKDDNNPVFTISADNSFTSKASAVFGNLEVLEKKHNAYEMARTDKDEMKSSWKSEPIIEPVSQMDAKPSFKRPTHVPRGQRDGKSQKQENVSFKVPPPREPSSSFGSGRDRNRGRLPFYRKKKTPEFEKEPEKWTKYSLADVNDEDLTDRSNKKAAFTFLNELHKRKEAGEEEADTSNDRIVFKKRSKQNLDCKDNRLTEEKSDSVKMGHSKIIQKEYVVGASVSSKRAPKKESCKVATSNKVALSHLGDDDDDDDDDE